MRLLSACIYARVRPALDHARDHNNVCIYPLLARVDHDRCVRAFCFLVEIEPPFLLQLQPLGVATNRVTLQTRSSAALRHLFFDLSLSKFRHSIIKRKYVFRRCFCLNIVRWRNYITAVFR